MTARHPADPNDPYTEPIGMDQYTASFADQVAELLDENKKLRKALVAFIRCTESGIAEKIVDGDPDLEAFREYTLPRPSADHPSEDVLRIMAKTSLAQHQEIAALRTILRELIAWRDTGEAQPAVWSRARSILDIK